MALPTYLFTTLSWTRLVCAVMLFFISGVAWCFNIWILPIVKLNDCLSAIDQFSGIAHRGQRWLDPLNAGIAMFLALAALLQSQHPDPAEATEWKTFAAASFTLFQVAWWERWTIFWLDNAAVALKEDTVGLKDDGDFMSTSKRGELHRILDMWAPRHAVRATLPLAAALMLLLM